MGLFTINNKIFPLYEGVNTIGRNGEAVVNIKHVVSCWSYSSPIAFKGLAWLQMISQHHAVVTILNGEFFISDLKSSNGSFLEHMRLVPLKLYPLKNDSKVTLGNLHGAITITSKGLLHSPPVEERLAETQTQSLFEGGTQLLEPTGDVHEELTQKIFWPPSVSRHLPGLQIDEIYDEHLSVLENFAEVEQDPPMERPAPPQANSDDEATDCEETTGPSGENEANKEEETFCDKSNESLEFLNKSPATALANGGESHGSSDDECFEFKRTRKSFMVISSQDFDDPQLEETIPATQYPSALQLDESDIIGATQAVRFQTQSSESEVFKLGLTESMDSSLTMFEQQNQAIEMGPTQTVQNNEEIYDAATQKVARSAEETFNIFEAPTQKIRIEEDSFLQPTQPMLFSEALEDVDYDSPTQKVSAGDTFLAPTQKLSLAPENDDSFLAPTQTVLPPKRMYSFKKTKCNLEASLSALADGHEESDPNLEDIDVEDLQAKRDISTGATSEDLNTNDKVQLQASKSKTHTTMEDMRKTPEVIAQPGEQIFTAEDVEDLQTKQHPSTGAKSEDSNENDEDQPQENKSEIPESLNNKEIEDRPKQAPGSPDTCAAVFNAQLETDKNATEAKFTEETVHRAFERGQPNGLNSSIVEEAAESSLNGTFKSIFCPERVTSDTNLNLIREYTIGKLQSPGKAPKSDSDTVNALRCDKSDAAVSHAKRKTTERGRKKSTKEPKKNKKLPLREDRDKTSKTPKSEDPVNSSVIDENRKCPESDPSASDKGKSPQRQKISAVFFALQSEDIKAPIENALQMGRQCRVKPSEEVKSAICFDQSMALLASKMVKTKKCAKTEEIQINFPKEGKGMQLSMVKTERPTRSHPKSSKQNEEPQSSKPIGRVAKRAKKDPEPDDDSLFKKLKLQSGDSLDASPVSDLKTLIHVICCGLSEKKFARTAP